MLHVRRCRDRKALRRFCVSMGKPSGGREVPTPGTEPLRKRTKEKHTMRKALIYGLTLTFVLMLTACGQPRPWSRPQHQNRSRKRPQLQRGRTHSRTRALHQSRPRRPRQNQKYTANEGDGTSIHSQASRPNHEAKYHLISLGMVLIDSMD